MSLNRCSEAAVAALLAFTVLAATAGIAGAVSVSGNTPASATVGSQQTATYTFTNLYSDYDAWTLRGKTDLTQVTWTVTLYDQTGAKITQHTYNSQQFSQPIKSSDGVNKVVVKVEGTVPSVSQYSYDPPQQQTMASFTQAQQGGASNPIGQPHEFRPYTHRSQSARNAIDDAKQSIQHAKSKGAGVKNANKLLQNAISAFGAKNFNNAEDLAGQAKTKADSAASSAKTTHWIYVGAGVVVVLVVIGAAVWWYRSQQDSYDRLG